MGKGRRGTSPGGTPVTRAAPGGQRHPGTEARAQGEGGRSSAQIPHPCGGGSRVTGLLTTGRWPHLLGKEVWSPSPAGKTASPPASPAHCPGHQLTGHMGTQGQDQETYGHGTRMVGKVNLTRSGTVWCLPRLCSC